MKMISSNQQQLFWSLLHQSAASANDIVADEKKIFLSSRLFENVSTNGSGWSSSLLDNIYSLNNGYLERLADILRALSDLEFKITLITDTSSWKWSREGTDSRLDSERLFLKSLLKVKNIEVRAISEFNQSYLQTPLGILKIGSPFTTNGFFGRSRLSCEYYSSKNQNHKIPAKDIQALIDKSIDYNSKINDIQDAPIPKVATSSTIVEEIIDLDTLSDDAIGGMIPLPKDSPEKYIPSTPSNFTPAGIKNEDDDAMQKSVIVQCNKLTIQIRDFLFAAMVNNTKPELSETKMSELLHFPANPSENYAQICDNVLNFLNGKPPSAQTTLKNHLYLHDERSWNSWSDKFSNLIKSVKNIFNNLSQNNSDYYNLTKRILRAEKVFSDLTPR